MANLSDESKHFVVLQGKAALILSGRTSNQVQLKWQY
jgi:hypothetical protein